MVKSMTGFGKGEATLQNKKITVEIRSLNSKQLDLSIKMPSAYRSLEPEIRTLATKALPTSRNTKSAISSPVRYCAARSMSS